MEDLVKKFKDLESRLAHLFGEKTQEENYKKIRELELISQKSDFWQDSTSAQETMRQLNELLSEKKEFNELKTSLETVKGLAALTTESAEYELSSEVAKIESRIENLESLSFLSGPYDKASAIVSIHSGQGGVEAMDWAAMLLRMYLRFAARSRWSSTLIDETKGEEAGIKSATVEITGKNVYGLLKKEAGAHRLVRQSPFNADNLRQTSFALVEVLPVITAEIKKKISPDEIEMETFRSSGPGGQNVQKVNTAVRLRHKPTGIVVTAQSERSQLQNRENAMKLLTAKLYLIEEEKRASQEKELKGEYKIAGWGHQIRSYVLHPYKQVKDLRTNVVSNAPDEVLDGNLESFIEAELKIK